MNKNHIICTAVIILMVILFAWFISLPDKKSSEDTTYQIPRIGQKLWTYHMNDRIWHNYDSKIDSNGSKEIIILQVQEVEDNGGYTSYHLLTGNMLIPKEDFNVGEGSREFLNDKKLYSYFPKNFEYYEIIFNGVNFKPRKLAEKEVSKLFKDFQIIKVSTLEKGTLTLDFSKRKNKFIILNDSGEDFYKYYIVPNESKKMEIGDFSNHFTVKDKTDIRIQRLEGCSKTYPCYEIKFK